ncbi:hypothetical protein McanCB56680_003729 [Microsporum canis]|uniref:Thioesterase family protein n=1 Tax=Arthroderma otae (strain ATCC MYA-4605 / CBS 113480) TaxID=554155 RepID=C5FMB1_ARTOC|nr:thioesterase family protein [Microsporum canis CBS 113480]EEQ31014.1 thioesterase family protein [Microsporum canis CBS 113480]
MSNEIHNKKARIRKDYPYHLEYRTRWSDNDMYSHLNNSIYAFLFDSIINSYLISHCGLNPFTTDSLQITTAAESTQVGLVVSSYCDYFASVAFPDVLDLGLRVVKLGKSSVTYEVGVFRQGEEAVKVVGGFTHVFVRKQDMKPTSAGMEATIRKGLERLVLERRSETSKL